MRRVLIVVGLLAATLLAVGCSPPTDAAMIDYFESHQSQFEELLRMFQEDKGLERVGDMAGTWPENPATVGVDHQRLELYEALMGQVGVKSLERYFGTMLFVTSSGGLVPNGYWKGYVYADTVPSPLVSNTEDCENGEFYRRIDDQWYIIYDRY